MGGRDGFSVYHTHYIDLVFTGKENMPQKVITTTHMESYLLLSQLSIVQL